MTLDDWFPERGPCLICGTGLDQRHRVLDAICDAVAAGDTPESVAEDCDLSLQAVEVAVATWDPATGRPR